MEGDNHPKKRALLEARERVIARLTQGFANDEIGIEEFERRINDAYQRRTVDELQSLVSDLDGSEPVVLPEASAEPIVVQAEVVPATATALATRRAPRMFARAILGAAERTGHFALPQSAEASAVLGSLVLDLRDVELAPGVTEVRVRAVLGSVEVFVPADVAVECEGSSILGSFEGTSRSVESSDPNAPRLRIVGSTVLGSIEVRSKPPARIQVRVEQLRARKLLPR